MYEFADPLFLFIPNAAGRGQAAAPTAKTGVRCEYPWRRQNPTRRRRDPSSVSAPQDDAPSGSRLRAARNHLPRRGRQGRPTPAGRGEPSAARYAFLCTARWTGGAKQMNKRAADQWSALRECGQGMCGHNSIPSIERADERESLAFGFPLRREASP